MKSRKGIRMKRKEGKRKKEGGQWKEKEKRT